MGIFLLILIVIVALAIVAVGGVVALKSMGRIELPDSPPLPARRQRPHPDRDNQL